MHSAVLRSLPFFGILSTKHIKMQGVCNMGTIVTKFGGSSLASAEQFKKVKAILLADPNRRYVVPSAPGRRFSGDTKVTDMLYQCHAASVKPDGAQAVIELDREFAPVAQRYTEIARELIPDTDISGWLKSTRDAILAHRNSDFAASRGEYLNGRILAQYLGWDFIDPAECVLFSQKGKFLAEPTNDVLGKALQKSSHAVIPGFYGSMPDGQVKTFSRGGSDITGAIVARAANADMYENWTDVSGFLMADPHIVDNPKRIERLTYRELRELSYMGAGVLHEDAVFPVRIAGIPTNIRNTNRPEDPGTLIVCEEPADDGRPQQTVTGIAGSRGFVTINIEKAAMNTERGFGMHVMMALYEYGISFEHLPTGIDTMCVVISENEFNMYENELLERINELAHPDSIEMTHNIALIATVGHGMTGSPGTAAKLFSALASDGINIRMIDQGSSELNIIIGVDVGDFERAMRAIYRAFVD